MLLEFTVENCRSYRDQVSLSLLDTRYSEQGVVHEVLPWGGGKSIGVLPVAGIFGANASGKTALLWAVTDMRALVLQSFRRSGSAGPLPQRPFELDAESRNRPTSFQVDLLLAGQRWQYGFEFDKQAIIEEYAYHYPKGRRALAFERVNGHVKFGTHTPAIPSIDRLLRGNQTLLLSLAGAIEHETLKPLYDWFGRNLLLAHDRNRELRIAHSAQVAAADGSRVVDMLRAADLGVSGVKRTPANISPEMKERVRRAVAILRGDDPDGESEDLDIQLPDFISLEHDSPAGPVEFSADDESRGTIVWLGLIGPVLDVLDGGHVLLADELDASLHPGLVRRLVQLFQDRTVNHRHAQLIFNAHDVTLLGDSTSRLLGRDQVWFAEKDNDGVSRLYPLIDFGPRNDESLERRYLLGRYGGVPIVDDGLLAALVSSPQ